MSEKLQKTGLILIVLLIVSFLGIQNVLAAEFPTKPIKIIVPSKAGGGHDLTFRAVCSVANDYLGQPIIIQLKPGGRGAIGTDMVAKAEPDGYTLLAGGLGWNSATPAIQGRSKGPDAFEAVCRINYNSIMIVARGDAPWKTFKELMAWVKENPGKLIIGTGSQYIQDDYFWRRMMQEEGISVKIVPYQGGGAQFAAVLGGHSDVGGAATAMYGPYKGTGKLIPLLWLDEKRHDMIPDVPSSVESGYNIVSRMWRGVLAPKGTPKPIIEKLAAAFKKMTEDKTVQGMISRYGDDIHYLGADEFTKVWQIEYDEFKEFAKTIKK